MRKWLQEHHQTATELVVGYHKVHTGKPTLSWSDSVDEAICFGWIDGIRKSIDADTYQIRFTPRKPDSIWSAINIRKVEALISAGRMLPSGLAAFEKRKESKSGVYSFEQGEISLEKKMEKLFRANKKAWKHFQACPPGYRKMAIWWVISAKQESTRYRRLEKLISASEAGIKPDTLRFGS